MNILPAVLAGGEGRRMGGAKPTRAWGPGTLIVNALRLARGFGDAPVVVLRRKGQAGEIDARFVYDRPDIEGPLAGLAAALEEAVRQGRDAVLILPCDMPLLPNDLAPRLGKALAETAGALAALPRTGDDLHPVCALWLTRALARLPAYLATGRRSLRGFAAACDGFAVDWPGPAHVLFANANTPEELARLAGLQAA